MKPTKLTTIILISMAVIVSASVLVFFSINQRNLRNQRLEKSVAPAVIKTDAKPKIVKPVEPYIQLPKYVKSKRVSKSLPKTAKATAMPAGAKGAAMAVKAPVYSQAAGQYTVGEIKGVRYII
jgi:hypothetical protein